MKIYLDPPEEKSRINDIRPEILVHHRETSNDVHLE